MSQPSARPSAVIVLAAGQGTRMKSTTPKIMHAIGGRSLVGHALAAAWSLAPEHLVAVVRHERARVAEHLETVAAQLGIDALAIADQDDVPGTGRAVELGLPADEADLVVDRVIAEQRGRIRRAEDPDDVVEPLADHRDPAEARAQRQRALRGHLAAHASGGGRHRRVGRRVAHRTGRHRGHGGGGTAAGGTARTARSTGRRA